MPLLDDDEVNWSPRRGVNKPEAAAALVRRARQVRQFIREVEAKRASGTGSQWGKIEDFTNRIQPELVELVARTFLDPDAVKWLVQQESHIRDAEHYLRDLERIATRLETLAGKLVPQPAQGDGVGDVPTLNEAMRSTFISYGAPDAHFARVLCDALELKGVRTFFFEYNAIPGERLHAMMRRGVNDHDRVVLVCSEASLKRPGVKNEIEETLAREARDGGASYLIPITLDNFVFEWRDALGQVLRDRVVADFRGAVESKRRFESAVATLLRALRV